MDSLLVAAVWLGCQVVQAITPTAAELNARREWMAARFEGGPKDTKNQDTQPGLFSDTPPFSFVYDGKSSSELFKQWKL